VSARVVSIAATGNGDTLALQRAPREASRTDANSAIIVIVGAFAGNGLASVGKRAPGESGLEGQTVSVVVTGTADGNLDAGLSISAPGEAGLTNADTAVIVIVRTFGRDNLALVSCGAP